MIDRWSKRREKKWTEREPNERKKAKMVKMEMGKKVERLWREGSYKLVHRVYEEEKGLRKIERGMKVSRMGGEGEIG